MIPGAYVRTATSHESAGAEGGPEPTALGPCKDTVLRGSTRLVRQLILLKLVNTGLHWH